jgi:hypothetical protein
MPVLDAAGWNPLPSGVTMNLVEYREALLGAMNQDGWPRSDSSCPISAAIRAGFPFAAAYLLRASVAECPATEALIQDQGGIPVGLDDLPIDWADWTEWQRTHTVRCPQCDCPIYKNAL